ncbi:MAG TPA: sugar phosphate isomerase/epimerase [Candidatus Latescibacteria bacterium]|nr:sugar phosphate isomerase/epimerase [Candidatus Latescibacterota bacterium]
MLWFARKPRLRISCLPLGLFRELFEERSMGFEDWIKAASKLKLDGIELYQRYLETIRPSELSLFSDFLRVKGLRVSMVMLEVDLLRPEEGERRRQVEMVGRGVDLARLFRADLVRVPISWPGGMIPGEVLEAAGKRLDKASQYAKARYARLAVEGVGGTPVGELRALWERPKVYVSLDTAQAIRSGEDPLRVLRETWDRVVHVRLSDLDARMEPVPLGEGVVDIEGMLALLKARRYSGWISVAPGVGGVEAIREGISLVREVWQAV